MGSSKIQGELWGKAPRGWAEFQEPMHKPLWESMLNAAEVGPGTRFLDAGCGGGGASVLAAERGARVSGLDAAEGLLAFARARVSNGDFRVGDLESLPYEDGAFDAVFAANSVQYAKDRIAALRELGRVCSPQGRIVAGLFGPPEKVEYRAIFKAVRDAMPDPPSGGGPFELSVPGKLEKLFAQAGLNVIESGEADCRFSYPDFETFWRANVAAGTGAGPDDSDQATLFEAIRCAFETIARREPVVIFLDDLQWADNATLGLLSTLPKCWNRNDCCLSALIAVTKAPAAILCGACTPNCTGPGVYVKSSLDPWMNPARRY